MEPTQMPEPFELHLIRAYTSTLYLVAYPNKLLLLDGGCRGDVERVCDYIKALGRDVSELKLVVVTHPHPDHMGGAAGFQRLGVPVAAPEHLNRWYGGLTGWVTKQVDLMLTHYVAYKIGRSWERLSFSGRLKAEHTLKEGDSLPGFDDWRVVSTPGHTSVDLSLEQLGARAEGVEGSTEGGEPPLLYIADCVVYTGRKYLTPYPIINPTAMRETLCKLKAYAARNARFLLAHGGEQALSVERFEALLSTLPERPKNHRRALLKRLGLLKR